MAAIFFVPGTYNEGNLGNHNESDRSDMNAKE
jgi:hypothetical protein